MQNQRKMHVGVKTQIFSRHIKILFCSVHCSVLLTTRKEPNGPELKEDDPDP
jgi:hypothetical protein